ncbi:DEAD-domain-containing protein [Violaceomyces palustris]|uniref:DEAD-domain-containing protein n=1 Tax=Violaceomyces palustris TaxID=1673888 RepID=A0ACD0NNQ3_9BASI|nr:DEAD-domain-containing protein [Violaceomyces palustris]
MSQPAAPPTSSNADAPASFPKIHPSRLNVAPALRASKARSSSNASKEKTKAKQRYLKAKKDRRKARKKAEPKRKHDSGTAPDQYSDPIDALSSSDEMDQETHDTETTLTEKAASHSPDAGASTRTEHQGTPAGGDAKQSEEEPGEGSDRESDASSSDSAALVDEEQEIRGLVRFPSAGKALQPDRSMVEKLGLPEGMQRSTIVSPSLSMSLGAAPQDGPGQKEEVKGESQGSSCMSEVGELVKSRLRKMGISEWFAVQVSVIPALLSPPHSHSLYRPFDPPRDICVSAPTGSGKTLAYTVPIVEVLRSRHIVRLRALIVLPTRDLVGQVRSTLEQVSKGSGLKIGTATGHHSFSHEQAQIMDLETGEPAVDVLICTPGRLIDHLENSNGFTLQHLRFLVIDEADRLMNQSFQEWMRRVFDATEPPRREKSDFSQGSLPPLPERPMAPYWLENLQGPGFGWAENVHHPVSIHQLGVQKLLFSATLTKNPAKIAALGLRDPHYITVKESRPDQADHALSEGSYALPSTLTEHMIVTSSHEKPLQLLRLLHLTTNPVRRALCFTKSVESASRLVKLVEIFEDLWGRSCHVGDTSARRERIRVCDYSSDLRASARQQILKRFNDGEIELLVCSDLISRGIDLPLVQHVVSYDVPVDLAKYVHRVGRTARAGRSGDAWTLVEEQEVSSPLLLCHTFRPSTFSCPLESIRDC